MQCPTNLVLLTNFTTDKWCEWPDQSKICCSSPGQCTCAQSPWLCFIHYTCATVYMYSVSMTVFYSLYMCYSVHVLQCTCATVYMCYSVHVLQCTCAQSPWLCLIHYTCATVYMCSVSMTVFYSLYMCYSVHVLSLHDCVLFIVFSSMEGMTVTDKPYQCSTCERAFIRKQDIDRHRCVTTRWKH